MVVVAVGGWVGAERNYVCVCVRWVVVIWGGGMGGEGMAILEDAHARARARARAHTHTHTHTHSVSLETAAAPGGGDGKTVISAGLCLTSSVSVFDQYPVCV